VGGSGAAVTPGTAYVIFSPSIPNPNGLPVICPVGVSTVAALISHFGYDGGSTVALANVAARSTGAFTGVTDSGLPIFDV